MTIAERMRALPPGTTAIAVSVVISGLASYGFLIVAARALGPDAYAPLSVMWVLAILIGPGLFLPIEQEMARALAIRSTRGIGSSRVVARAAALAAALLVVVLVVLAIARELMTTQLFHDRGHVADALALALVGYAAAHLTKGVLAGTGRFGSYARFTAVEAIARLGLVAVLGLAAARSPAPYAFAVALATFLGIAASLWRTGRLVESGPPAAWRELTASLASLLAASLLSLGLANVGPVAVQLLADDPDSDAIAFLLLALVVARVPLFLFQALQAGLVPRIATLASSGEFTRLRRELRHILGIVVVIGSVGVVVAGVVGPLLVRMLFGDEYRVGARTMVLLAVASSLFMIASVVAQAAIAVGGQTGTAWAWGLALAVFAVTLAAPVEDLYLRVELASVISCCVAVAAQTVCFRNCLRRTSAAPQQRPESVS